MLALKTLRQVHKRRRTFQISRDELLARNLGRFRQLAAFVRKRCPYYAMG